MVTINLGGAGGAAAEAAANVLLVDRDPGVGALDVVYINAANQVDKADASSVSTIPAVGFVNQVVGAMQAKVQTNGVLSGFSGLTVGAPVYLSTTAGGITQSPPGSPGQVVQELGFAFDTDKILIILDGDAVVNA